MRRIFKSFWLAGLLAAGMTIVSGLAFGWLDARWANPPDMAAIGSKLDDLPDHCGDWTLAENQELPAGSRQLLRCYGDTLRVYVNPNSGHRVTVAVLLGPRGPIAVHTPEICYSGQGVEQQGPRQRIELISGGVAHALWHTDFLSKVDGQPELEVFYAWSDGGPWQAAEQPRFWLTDRLYKIQLAGPPPPAGQPSESLQFLESFVEQLQPQLVPTNNPL